MKALFGAVSAVVLTVSLLLAQQDSGTNGSKGSSNSSDSSDQAIPDAPSAQRPAPSPFPASTAPAPAIPARPDNSSATPDNTGSDNPAPPPPPVIRRVPAGQSTPADGGRDELFTLVKRVNFVLVPVTVKDGGGHLVEGLLKKDFSIMENGEQQNVTLFTSDPFPLSVAVVLDANLPDQLMRKVNETLPALAGAFSQFDEVGLYVYGSTVQRKLDYGQADDKLTSALRRVKVEGRGGGVPVIAGPMAAGPTVNGHPLDPSTPQIRTYQRESSVLNDAILAAAQDLSRRERTRRKILFVISDGFEYGSNAGYGDVLKVLLSNEISVYAIGVDSAAMPAYRTLQKIRIPGMGTGNILPKYASATGGEVFAEFTKDAIEGTYAHVTEVARNQYTLGYTTKGTAASNYRSIEVKVHRAGLLVYAKDGYYPLPPSRQ